MTTMNRGAWWICAVLVVTVVVGARSAASPLGERATLTIDGGRCNALAVRDDGNGTWVSGIEDIAGDPSADAVFLSAYDRQSAEAGEEFNSGLYRLTLADLPSETETQSVRLRNLLPETDGPFAGPHGIDARQSDEGLALAAIMHRYRDGDIVGSEVVLYDVGGERLSRRARAAHPDLCGANDLAIAGASEILVTKDHGNCGGLGRLIEDLNFVKGGQGSLWHLRMPGSRQPKLSQLSVEIGYANGVAIIGDTVYVASTRAERLLAFDRAALWARAADPGVPLVSPNGSIALDGGPDNITQMGPGEILIGVHPSLFEFALYRYGLLGFGTSASRVILYDEESKSARAIVDDPEGAAFSGATVGARLGVHLVAGSAVDSGLLLCRNLFSGNET